MQNACICEFEYLDENDFRNKERALKKYNLLAYRELVFNYYPKLREGNFLGKEVSRNEMDKTVTYELELPTNELFEKVHGKIILHYIVCIEKGIIILANILPEDIWIEGSTGELPSYKGVVISIKNREKDMFKIDLLTKVKEPLDSETKTKLKKEYLSNVRSEAKFKTETSTYRKITNESTRQYVRCKIFNVLDLERKKKSLNLLIDKYDEINEKIKNEIYEKIYSSSEGKIREFFDDNKITNLDKIFSIYKEPNPPKKNITFYLYIFVIIISFFCIINGHNKISSLLWIVVLLMSIYVGVIHGRYFTSNEYTKYAVYGFLDYYFSVELLNYSLVYSVYTLDILKTAKNITLGDIKNQKEYVKELLRMESYDEDKITKYDKELKSRSEVYDDLIEYFTEQIKSMIYKDTVCTLDDVKKGVESWIEKI